MPTGAEAPGRSGTPVSGSLVASSARIVYDAVGDIDDDELDEEEEEEEEEVGAGPAMRFGSEGRNQLACITFGLSLSATAASERGQNSADCGVPVVSPTQPLAPRSKE